MISHSEKKQNTSPIQIINSGSCFDYICNKNKNEKIEIIKFQITQMIAVIIIATTKITHKYMLSRENLVRNAQMSSRRRQSLCSEKSDEQPPIDST